MIYETKEVSDLKDTIAYELRELSGRYGLPQADDPVTGESVLDVIAIADKIGNEIVINDLEGYGEFAIFDREEEDIVFSRA